MISQVSAETYPPLMSIKKNERKNRMQPSVGIYKEIFIHLCISYKNMYEDYLKTKCVLRPFKIHHNLFQRQINNNTKCSI